MSAKKVLITGTSGLVGGILYEHLSQFPERYAVYGLDWKRAASDPGSPGRTLPDDRFYLGDVADFDAVQGAVDGKDLVVHMAANADPEADWEAVLSSNIIGSYTVLEASRKAGVERVVNASSIMVNWGCRRDPETRAVEEAAEEDLPAAIPQVTHLSEVRPDCLYGASKVWVETLSRAYAEAHGMSVICVRVGAINKTDENAACQRSWWCSYGDIARMIECCIEAPADVRFDIFYGLSANPWRWMDLDHAKAVVGFEPVDRAQ
ncbi:MAG: NAD(P)-dependent oxidoreductase [Lentisphaeria bacterium]|jgi:nucleoside-diphosphate-sugar epimerase|nr:NAD(P)-dependent oxidoreductase [Lentisphaeria bacterium]